MTQGRQMLLNDEPLHLRGVLDQGYFPAGWCAQRAFVEAMVSLTQALDPTRPVVGNDGWEFSRGDLWTLHLYDTETETIAGRLQGLMKDRW